MLTSKELALAAHRDLLRRIGELQQQIVQRKLLWAEFGPDALPPHDFPRMITDGLRNASERMERDDRYDRERLAELTKQCRAFEILLVQAQEGEDEAFNAAVRDTLRQRAGASQ